VLDPGSDVDSVAGPLQGRPLLKRLMRPVAVVMPGVLVQNFPQVVFADDQQVV
jgi:hypothetical protein